MAALLIGVVAVDLARPLPAEWLRPVEARQVLDRHGGVIAERAVPSRGRDRWVELDAVAPAVVDALVAAEDRRFWWHPGVDPLSIARAALANGRAGRVVQGGSTLTQQTARLLAARPAGMRGKLVEARWAIRLDLHLTKHEILTWYLNRAYFGRGAWGIEAAARAWFDESPAGLSVAEAAALVALLPAPDRLSPDADPAASERRRHGVLERMVAAGTLSRDEADRAAEEPLQLRRRPRAGLAPHLAARVLDARPEQVTLPTTLDPDLQRHAEEVVRDVLAGLEGRDVDHAAVLVADVETGEVLAYVGSGSFDAEDGQNDGVRAVRSTGSTLKPLLYAMAFEGGLTPATVLPDLPRRWTTSHGSWSPRNYGETFHGPVPAREALACSYNLPAVAVLEQVGVASALQRLERAGLAMPHRPAHYGLGLAIGGAEVALEDMVALYAGLARGGDYMPLRMLRDEPIVEPVPFLEPHAAWLVTDVLSDPVARTPAFGRRGPLARPFPAAAKTGTSADFRDNWTIGYTARHVVGVWVGNFDGRPMGEVSGVTGAGPIWARIVDEVARREGAPAFPPMPDGLVRRSFCRLSGEPAGPSCPHVVDDAVRQDHPVVGATPCTWHVEGCGVAWPSAYRSWAADQGLTTGGDGCPVDGPVAIAWPVDGAVLYVDPTLPAEAQRIPLRPSAPSGAREARWSVDGVEVDEPGAQPLEVLWTPSRRGTFRIELVVDGVAAPPIRVDVGGVEG